jgi:hypothetical protein
MIVADASLQRRLHIGSNFGLAITQASWTAALRQQQPYGED